MTEPKHQYFLLCDLKEEKAKAGEPISDEELILFYNLIESEREENLVDRYRATGSFRRKG